MTVYAGDRGGCMLCDSLGSELAIRGHRPRCSSPYAKEPSQPREVIIKQFRDAAMLHEAQAVVLRLRADRLEAGDETAREGELA